MSAWSVWDFTITRGACRRSKGLNLGAESSGHKVLIQKTGFENYEPKQRRIA
jgi:hypothetical protein